jgi:hypothetical protein
VLLRVTCPFILEFASCHAAIKRAVCQQLVEQCMTEIASLYSFGKVILLSNIIPICDVFYAKKAFMYYVIFLRVTLVRLYTGEESSELTYLCFIVFQFIFPEFQAL